MADFWADWIEALRFGCEVQGVISARLMLFASGTPDAVDEAGRMVAEYGTAVAAETIVIGTPTQGGLPAAIDGSVSRELLRSAQSNILIVNPAALLSPATPAAELPRSSEAPAPV